MATDLFKQVLFNDGQGITHTDYNNAEKYLLAALQDQILATLIPNVGLTVTAGSHDLELGSQANAQGLGPDWATIATSRAFCLQPGHAFLRQGSAGTKVQISAGTLFQLTNTTLTGDEPKFLSYSFVGNEEFTLTAGDGVNPRVDLLQMKLEYVNGSSESRDFEDATTRVVTSTAMNTKRRVQCTLSVKAGTAAATPATPDPDAGYCVIGSVYVNSIYVGGSVADIIIGQDPTIGADNAYIMDQRIPLRIKAYRVEPAQFTPTTAWTIANNDSATATNATNELRVPCPGHIGRILGVAIEQGNAVAIGSHTLVQIGLNGNATSSTPVTLQTVAFPATNNVPSLDAVTFEATPLFAGASVEPTQSAVAKICVPVWTNGFRAPVELYKQGAAGRRSWRTLLRVVNAPNTAIITGVVFFIAEGL